MIYDIIVVGGGPTGLTAGANASNRGLKTLVLEGQSIPGGQPATFYPKKRIIDHPGFPKGVTGKDLSNRLYQQALNSNAEVILNEPMIDCKLTSDVKKIITKNKSYECKKVILATGLHNIPRHLDELIDYKGKHVHYFVKDPKAFRNKNVLIIGAGDTAFDRAHMIGPKSKSCTVLVRSTMAKAKQNNLDRANEQGIKILYKSKILKLNADKTAVIETGGKKETIKVDDVVVSIGFVSSLDVLNRMGLKRDEKGMIIVDERMETSIPGVFAAGDLVGDVKLIAVGCASGIIAAINTFNSIRKPYWLGTHKS